MGGMVDQPRNIAWCTMFNGRPLYVAHVAYGGLTPFAKRTPYHYRYEGSDDAFGSWLDAQTAMTRDHTVTTPITSIQEFQTALAAIVETAVVNGIDVRGAWEFQTSGSTHNWEVEISELAKSFEVDEE